MPAFQSQPIESFAQFVEFMSCRRGEWIYRGQSQNHALKTSLERVLDDWDIRIANGPGIERQLIREFRRKYRGEEQPRIQTDTLFCMSVMQHHGAPTRLMDWTYSGFVAAKFAIERGFKNAHPVIWCLNTEWLLRTALNLQPDLVLRLKDGERNEETFRKIYLEANGMRRFVMSENPLKLNQRLEIQQGVFLCAGDTARSTIENLQNMNGWDLEENIVTLSLTLVGDQFVEFARMLRRMNVSSASLFPGLDGSARALGEHMFHYKEFADGNVGSL